MQGAFHAGAVVGVELADAFGDVVYFGAGDFLCRKRNFAVHKAGGGDSSEVNDDFEQFFAVVRLFYRMANVGG